MINPTPQKVQIKQHIKPKEVVVPLLSPRARGQRIERAKIEAVKRLHLEPEDKIVDMSRWAWGLAQSILMASIVAAVIMAYTMAQAGTLLNFIGSDNNLKVTRDYGPENWDGGANLLPVRSYLEIESQDGRYRPLKSYGYGTEDGGNYLGVGIGLYDSTTAQFRNLEPVPRRTAIRAGAPPNKVWAITALGDSTIIYTKPWVRAVSNNKAAAGETLTCYDSNTTPCAGTKIFMVPLDTVGVKEVEYSFSTGICCNVAGGVVAPDISVLYSE